MNRETSNNERNWQFTDRAKKIGRGVTGVVLTGVIAAGIGSMARGASGEAESQDIPTRTEVAHTGDTLWDMTDDVKNMDDKREVIDWVEDNSPDLADGTLDAGDTVVLPQDAKHL